MAVETGKAIRTCLRHEVDICVGSNAGELEDALNKALEYISRTCVEVKEVQVSVSECDDSITYVGKIWYTREWEEGE